MLLWDFEQEWEVLEEILRLQPLCIQNRWDKFVTITIFRYSLNTITRIDRARAYMLIRISELRDMDSSASFPNSNGTFPKHTTDVPTMTTLHWCHHSTVSLECFKCKEISDMIRHKSIKISQILEITFFVPKFHTFDLQWNLSKADMLYSGHLSIVDTLFWNQYLMPRSNSHISNLSIADTSL